MRTITSIARIGVAALLLTTVGCGKIAEKATEKATEKAIENETGGDADVDLSSGKVKVSDGKGGTYEIDASGSADLPDGFPAALEVPGTTKIIQVTDSSAEGSKLQSITVQFDGDVESTYAAYRDQVTGAGFEVQSDSVGGGDQPYGNVIASDGSLAVVAVFGLDGDGTGVATISVTPQE